MPSAPNMTLKQRMLLDTFTSPTHTVPYNLRY